MSFDLPISGPIWLVGAGNMAGAMLSRWLEAGLDPGRVIVIRRNPQPMANGITVLSAPPPDGSSPAVLMLGVKPQMLDDIAPALADVAEPETLLVSILAGVEAWALRQRFPKVQGVLRAMPNTPVAIGRGVVALCGDGLSDAQQGAAEALMAPLGLVEWVPEAMFDQITALAGSGPAFLYRFVDALAKAGAAAGLPADQAQRLATATVEGAAMLAAQSNEDCGTLAERVASPGGSTRRGLDVMDADGALDRLIEAVIAAAVARNREMAEAARG